MLKPFLIHMAPTQEQLTPARRQRKQPLHSGRRSKRKRGLQTLGFEHIIPQIRYAICNQSDENVATGLPYRPKCSSQQSLKETIIWSFAACVLHHESLESFHLRFCFLLHFHRVLPVWLHLDSPVFLFKAEWKIWKKMKEKTWKNIKTLSKKQRRLKLNPQEVACNRFLCCVISGPSASKANLKKTP